MKRMDIERVKPMFETYVGIKALYRSAQQLIKATRATPAAYITHHVVYFATRNTLGNQSMEHVPPVRTLHLHFTLNSLLWRVLYIIV